MPFSIRSVWERLRSHILFIPAVLALLGILLAVTMVEIDRRLDPEDIRRVPWIFRAGASGARDLLATVAVSMVQLAAITFSVTIVALALRSQQFGPRLLRNFTADQVNQGILGAFIGTFVYSLLVLRAVRDLDDNAAIEAETFVPLLAVTTAILLALVSLALFVIFIDRVVSSIQANSIIARVADETRQAIDALFPEPLGEDDEGADGDENDAETVYQPLAQAVEIMAPKTGYIQTLDADRLMNAARDADIVLRMEAPIGGFVIEGTPIAVAAPRERVDKQVVSAVRQAYTIGSDRSVTDDPEFGVRQIVDVAIKALSPSDNDPTTACTATEYLGALLIDFATRSLPSRLRRDGDGNLRVIALRPTFRRMVDLAFNQIREHGADDVAATMQLLETLIRLAAAIEGESRRRVLEEHAWKISRTASRGIRDPIDRDAVNERLQLAMERLGRESVAGQQYLIALQSA